ncbi:uncharacterized protein Bfra_007462 [Botrytis fragariae]|uniref:Uncharacterized protein n=1 Tax=Botrytis fragariae TaxID=1964551 RepID=A0A8H6AJ50_9HELO|nr:uncharacterized protein Bfra_007462 [Botrytis fragariae]KAF5868265.1 hypothetical protein Bfra_007462 [Botrytis fragariae]
MSDNLQEVQMEGLTAQELEETVSFFVERQEFKLNRSLLFRKVDILKDENFPLPLRVDIESFRAFSVWLHHDHLPMLQGIYHETSGQITYSGYDPENLYRLATFFDLCSLADNVMDCIRKAHNSLGVGFSKDAITKIYNQQLPHWGLTLYAALWIHLEDTRPNNYMKLTTKAERDDLLENQIIAADVNLHRGPWYPGSQSACRFHLHLAHMNEACIRNHSVDLCTWVIDKDGMVEELQNWRTKRLLNPVNTQSNLSSQVSEASVDTSSD